MNSGILTAIGLLMTTFSVLAAEPVESKLESVVAPADVTYSLVTTKSKKHVVASKIPENLPPELKGELIPVSGLFEVETTTLKILDLNFEWTGSRSYPQGPEYATAGTEIVPLALYVSDDKKLIAVGVFAESIVQVVTFIRTEGGWQRLEQKNLLKSDFHHRMTQFHFLRLPTAVHDPQQKPVELSGVLAVLEIDRNDLPRQRQTWLVTRKGISEVVTDIGKSLSFPLISPQNSSQ